LTLKSLQDFCGQTPSNASACNTKRRSDSERLSLWQKRCSTICLLVKSAYRFSYVQLSAVCLAPIPSVH
jgi:hypothetical protein